MKTISIIICVLSGLLAVANQPNVVLILTDDQGYGEIGAHGNKQISTPHLDRLHADSIRLTNFHVNSVCSPSRAALITGQYAARVGVWHTLGGRNLVRKDARIIAQFFQDGGYRTQLAGKWHLGDNYPYRPEDRGFVDVFRIGGGSLGQVADYWGNSLWDGHYLDNGSWVKTKGFSTDVQMDRTIEFIKNKSNKPFFCMLATTAPHSPVGADEKYIRPYRDAGLSKEIATFYGMITNLDHNVGRLRQALTEQGLAENTIVIFATDNGTACDKKADTSFNDGMRGRKGSLFDGGHRVPCFIHWPKGGWTGGRDLEAQTAHVDILPTLVDACTLPNPHKVQFDGVSLNKALRQPSLLPTRTIITEGKVNKRDVPFDSCCIIRDRWRLVNGKELYDRKQDPGQKHDLSKQEPEVVKSMRQAYDVWRADVSSAFADQSRFPIGAERVELFSMDLFPLPDQPRGNKVVWNQKGVLKGEACRGYWALTAEEAGRYRITLRRWPSYIDHTIRGENMHKATPIHVRKAIIQAGNQRQEVAVSATAISATAVLNLPAGPINLQAEFIDDKGTPFSAYYVDVQLEKTK